MGTGRWVGRSDRRRGIFIHKVPNWQISRRWEVLSERSSHCSPHFLHAFPKYLLPDTFGDAGLIWADCSCFNDTFEQRAADAAAPLLEHCSSPETAYKLQCPRGVCVGGGSLTVGQHLGFLNTGGLLLTSKGRYPQE